MSSPGRPPVARISSTQVKEKPMNKDQFKGTVKMAAGKVQETVGKAVGSTEQQVHGIKKQLDGQAEKTVGAIKEAVKDVTKK
jgi:uncharacterized protein YjbJ (UPF0337 family)